MRKKFIVTKEYNLVQLLKELREINDRVPDESLKERSELKGGTLAAAKADLKILELVYNGHGSIQINQEGIRFLENSDFESRKKTYLKIPLFQEMNNNWVKTLDGAKKFLYPKLKESYPNEDTLKRNVKAIARRYVEMILGIRVGRERKRKKVVLRAIQSKESTTQIPLDVYIEIKSQLDEDVDVLKRLVKKHGANSLIRALEKLKS